MEGGDAKLLRNGASSEQLCQPWTHHRHFLLWRLPFTWHVVVIVNLMKLWRYLSPRELLCPSVSTPWHKTCHFAEKMGLPTESYGSVNSFLTWLRTHCGLKLLSLYYQVIKENWCPELFSETGPWLPVHRQNVLIPCLGVNPSVKN